MFDDFQLSKCMLTRWSLSLDFLSLVQAEIVSGSLEKRGYLRGKLFFYI